MEPKLMGGLDADDAQQLMVEVQRGIPANRSKVKMNAQVRAFRARVVTEMREFDSQSGNLDLTPELVAPPR
jgi:hypothetical protein